MNCKGAAGLGVSANVRAAYGFLVDNYNDGDKIYFFGFSRGAYTARAIASMVCQLGLLTTRGMDNFSIVYKDFYNDQFVNYSEDRRQQLRFRPPLPRFTVEIIGVWDTVAFHKSWLGERFGEKLEFRNTILSTDVKCAFHALSLDEERTAYQPTLWHIPQENEGQELLQVWFSGVHTDVGGGAEDPRLSNISLAWMIAQCTKNKQLSVDIDYYLFDDPPRPREADTVPWATNLGKNSAWSIIGFLTSTFLGTSKRIPLAYRPTDNGLHITNEMIHESINDCNCAGQSPESIPWPCAPLRARRDADTWVLTDGHEIHLHQLGASHDDPSLDDPEKYMKGRIRTVHADRED